MAGIITAITVPAVQVFNLPLFECFIVIDVRSKEQYDAGHVVTALSFPALSVGASEEAKLANLFKFLAVATTSLPERYSPVVIYSDAELTSDAQDHITWLLNILNKLKGDNLALTVSASGTPILKHKKAHNSESDEEREYNPVQSFCDTLVRNVKNLWIIEGGYEGFKAVYPFLCGNLHVPDMKPLPHQIEDNLFLGSRAFEISPESLQQLNINYVIVNKSHENATRLAINNVSFLECDVEDESTENMSDCWRTSIAFIRAATEAGGRVLIQLWGRSRSASVVLAWLMVSKGWTMEAADQFLLSKCSSVDRSLIFKNQLQEFIKTTKTIAHAPTNVS